MDEQIAVGDLFERRAKRRHERLGQVADKSDSVVDDDFLIVRQTQRRDVGSSVANIFFSA